MVVQLTVGSVGEAVGEIPATVSEGDSASSAVEVVSGVCSVGLFLDEAKAVDIIGGAYAS